MIVITEIKTIEVDRNTYVLQLNAPLNEGFLSTLNGRFIATDDSTKPKDFVKTEIVKGRRFVKPNGEEICIGTSEQAAKVIGIQYDAWDDIHTRLYRVTHTSHKRYEELESNDILIERFLFASFFQRLKWLFTGVTL